jgi:hypothetical protein
MDFMHCTFTFHACWANEIVSWKYTPLRQYQSNQFRTRLQLIDELAADSLETTALDTCLCLYTIMMFIFRPRLQEQ